MALLDYELEVTVVHEDKHEVSTTKGLARVICRDNWFAQDDGEALYYYKDGVYKPNARRAIELAARDVLDRFSDVTKGYSSYKAAEAFKYISAGAPRLLEKPDANIINCQNGLYDIKLKILKPHTPEYRTATQLQVTFDPLAECPAWDNFISDVFPDEEGGRQVGYEIVAWLMTPFTCSQKCVVLLGSGANGKSVYIEGISELLGEDNICNIPWQKIEDRFTTVRVKGKLANIASDLPNNKITSTSAFKALVSGEPMLGEYKNGAIFNFKPFARCLFACNELPDTCDNSDGFYRRLNIIQFPKTFKEDPSKKAEFTRTLHRASELSGLLNRAIACVGKVFLEGITVTESMTQVLEDHRKENDPVSIWFDEFTVENRVDELGNQLDNLFIPMTELYQAYRSSGNGGQAAKSAVAFGKSLKRYRSKVFKKQRRIDGMVTWVYEGIRLKTEIEDIDWQSSDDLVHDKEDDIQ